MTTQPTIFEQSLSHMQNLITQLDQYFQYSPAAAKNASSQEKVSILYLKYQEILVKLLQNVQNSQKLVEAAHTVVIGWAQSDPSDLEGFKLILKNFQAFMNGLMLNATNYLSELETCQIEIKKITD